MLAPGQMVDDFSWPSAVQGQPGQRLAEQRGYPVMLIWTDDCHRCEERLARYQLLAQSYRHQGLVTWVIWTPQKNKQPPVIKLPVLEADPHWKTGWQLETTPAVMMINGDGRLDHLLTGGLADNYRATEKLLSVWLSQQPGKGER
ncbi:MAG: hypothetical protein CMH98_03005 [Oceanospirillaceae bacterium]|nr:hypothetical protein [Oceanospirillaceae bacterium]